MYIVALIFGVEDSRSASFYAVNVSHENFAVEIRIAFFLEANLVNKKYVESLWLKYR